jgi:hypothetical protein
MRKRHAELLKMLEEHGVRIARFNDFEPDENHSWARAGVFKTPFKFSAEKLLNGEEDWIIEDADSGLSP